MDWPCVKALSNDARLAGHVVHQSDEDVIGVTMSQVVCNEEQVCTGTTPAGDEEDEYGGGGGGAAAAAAVEESGRADVFVAPRRWRRRQKHQAGGRRGGGGGDDEPVDEANPGDGDDDDDDDDQKGGVGHNRGWMRAVVDMYVASLADGDVQLPGSSFMNGAAGALSITNRAQNALRFGGEVVLDQMVTPRGQTRERSAGYQKKPENYVLLSASHCKFEKHEKKEE